MQSNRDRQSQITAFRLDELAGYCRELLTCSSEAAVGRTLREMFSELLKGLSQHLPFDHFGLGLHNPRTDTLEVVLQAGENLVLPELAIHENSLRIVLEQRRPIEVIDAEEEGGFADLCERARSDGFRSFRVVPLCTERRTLGALAIVRKQAGDFSIEERQHIDHAAQLIALVVENAVMADVLGKEKDRLETLLDVNTTLMSSLDMQRMFREVSGLIRRVVNQDYTYLTLYDKDQDAMKFYLLESGKGSGVVCCDTLVCASECPAGISYKRGENMQFTHDDLALIGSEYAQSLMRSGIRTVSCFLLVNHGRKFGTLDLASMHDCVPSHDDQVLLTQIASQVGMAMDNARAYEEIGRLKDKLAKEKLYLEEEIRSQHNFGEVIGNSSALLHVLNQVEIAAPSDATVLLLGETGTGKELIARAVHRLSSRRENNFIKLNCAAIPTGLLESELFGHEKGAFTGAISQKVGRLELADKGTLFLDEIGEIPMELQPKLLRVLQDHEFERLGGLKTIKVNVRIIAATNRDLGEAVEMHQFRSDLYYRLNVFPLRLPALRDRAGDIPLLARYFVQKFAHRMGKAIESIPVEVIQELEQWCWPGNIRELENFLERSVILTQGPVLFAPLSELRLPLPERDKRSGTLEAFERDYILRTLREAGGVVAGIHGAAARLGMKRTTLQSRMQRLGINREEYET